MEAARDEMTSKLADTVATHEKVRGALLVQLQELQSEQRANLKKIEEQERATEHLRAKLEQPRPVSIAREYKLAYLTVKNLASRLFYLQKRQVS